MKWTLLILLFMALTIVFGLIAVAAQDSNTTQFTGIVAALSLLIFVGLVVFNSRRQKKAQHEEMIEAIRGQKR